MGALFDDGKDDGALRTIGEVSEALGIKTHVLRYWEQQFPMLDPLKRSGGRRYYRTEDVRLVQEIDRLVNRDGYTIKGAVAALKSFDMREPENQVSPGGHGRDVPGSAGGPPIEQVSGDRSDMLARLKTIRATLAAALAG